jgi:AraC-like DNA-binding protein
MLTAASIDAALLDDPRARVGVEAFDMLTKLALVRSGDPAFGLRMGEHAKAAAFGLIGPMVAQCRTIEESFEHLLGYYRIVADVAPPRLEELDGRIHLVCDALRGDDEDCNRVRTEFLMVRLMLMGRQFLGPAEVGMELWFDYPRPAHAAEYARLFGGRERFDKPCIAVVFEKALMQIAQRHHDLELLIALRTQADRVLGELVEESGIVPRIRQVIVAGDVATRPEMNDVARKLGLSERSLRRRLEAAGASFNSVVHEARGAVATKLLGDPGATIDDVARALGFNTTATFTRAFKRWTGKRPSELVARRSEARAR